MKKKKFPWGKGIMLLFGIGIGVCCGLAMIPFLDRLDPKTMGFGAFLGVMAALYVCILIALPVQVAVHEAGHLLFGLLTGYGFSSYRIGSLMFLKENGKLRLRRHRLAGTGGQCLMTPPDMVQGKFPYVLYNLGGCILNLLVGALCFCVSLLLPKGSFASAFFVILAVAGAGSALLNGIPLNNGTVPNDGHNALSLGKDPRALQAFWTQMKMVEQLSKGIRLKDMPEAWFALPEEQAMQNPMVASMAVLYCNRLLDMGQIRQADSCMEKLLDMDSAMAGLHRGLLTCERIFCLLAEGEKEHAARLYTSEQKKFMRAMATSLSVIRAEYALAVADADEKKARQCLERFEKQAQRYPYPCEVVGERELLAMLEKTAV